MLFWFIFFPYLERVTIDLESSTENITYECYSTTPGFLYGLLAFNCALLLFGCFLAIKTRKLPQNYNESKHLAFSVSAFSKCVKEKSNHLIIVSRSTMPL